LPQIFLHTHNTHRTTTKTKHIFNQLLPNNHQITTTMPLKADSVSSYIPPASSSTAATAHDASPAANIPIPRMHKHAEMTRTSPSTTSLLFDSHAC
jgi:hypothetical protein